jgi:hypothetical protein
MIWAALDMVERVEMATLRQKAVRNMEPVQRQNILARVEQLNLMGSVAEMEGEEYDFW